MIRYGNDLVLTIAFRDIKNHVDDLNACIRDGHLDEAFKRALLLDDASERLQERLNQIKYRADEIGQG